MLIGGRKAGKEYPCAEHIQVVKSSACTVVQAYSLLFI